MEVEGHEGEPPGALDEFLAMVDVFLDAFGEVAVEGAVLGGFHEPFVRGDEEAAGAASGVADGEVRASAGVGLHAADDGLDEDARGEILAGTFLAFAGGLRLS